MRMRFQPQSRSRHARAFTLIEVLITMVTTVFIMGGALAAYIYGLKMMQFTQPKLSASDGARKAVGQLTEDIRSAFDVKIGNRSGSTFTLLAPFTPQAGNALRIYPSTNTSQFIFYFWDANDNTLKRTTNNATYTSIMAEAVSNSMVFTAEDFRGNILTNDVNIRVFSVTLQFYQLQYPKVAVGPGSYYDWYKVQTKVTKRTMF